ncbi:CNNM domain-containing protein [Quadrisphaera sp. INWT6]|uniref:CNNM domain-containing protein n=1 Tax=Quadrisphaera sp. INWT6 TaxID=2596917 RepID=UPI0018928100|nr:hemolysin family protein [Quadrisphaera sp. INWT6]
MSGPVVAVATVALIGLSAFFVAVEFALLAARRHRLEDMAQHSRGAQVALRNSSELTVLLAGSQLGITACTLGLGAVTKPAVHYALTPLFTDWGLPGWAADVSGFVLALVVVTFLHLVVGEMAPKSWAIAHPEESAVLLARPMQLFMLLTRPLLRAMNETANWCLRRVGVEPADQVASGRSPADLRQLVEHSASTGALDAAYSAQLSGALDMQRLQLAEVVRPGRPAAVPAGAAVADVRRAAQRSGHLRILVGDPAAPSGVVHVRDVLAEPVERPVADLARPVLSLAATTPVHEALTTMRETRNHLVVVTGEGGGAVGVVTLTDLLRRLFPRDAAAPVASAAAPAPA